MFPVFPSRCHRMLQRRDLSHGNRYYARGYRTLLQAASRLVRPSVSPETPSDITVMSGGERARISVGNNRRSLAVGDARHTYIHKYRNLNQTRSADK